MSSFQKNFETLKESKRPENVARIKLHVVSEKPSHNYRNKRNEEDEIRCKYTTTVLEEHAEVKHEETIQLDKEQICISLSVSMMVSGRKISVRFTTLLVITGI